MTALLLALLGLFASPARAAPPPGRVPVATFGPAEGLTGGQVRALALTPDGTLLVGTEVGVSRFDGRRFSPIEVAPVEDGEPPFFSSLLSTPTATLGQLNGGVVRIEGDEAELLLRLDTDDVNTGQAVDAQGRVVLANEQGLQRFDPATGTLETLLEPTGAPLPAFRAVSVDEDGVWLGAASGLYRWEDGALSQHHARPVRAFLDHPGHGLLVGGNDGLFAVSDLSTRLGPEAFVTDLALLPDGRIVASCGAGLLYEGLDGDWVRLTQDNGLDGDIFTRVVVDRDGIVWAGSLNQGLMRFDALDLRIWTTAEGLPSPHVTDLVVDDGDLVVSSHRGVLRLTADGEVRPEPGLETLDVMRWRRFSDGVWLLPTLDAPQRVAPDGTRTPQSDITSFTGQLIEDAAGALWYLRQFEGDRLRPTPLHIADDSGDLYEAQRGPDGAIRLPWRRGVGRLTSDGVEQEAPAPPGCAIVKFAFYKDDLWGGCAESLWRWRNDRWVEQERPPFLLRGLGVAGDALYLTTPGTLHRVAPTPGRLGHDSGMPRIALTYSQGPVLHNGWLALEASVGVLFVHPSRFDRAPRAPTARIAQVRSGKRVLSRPLQLGSDDDDLQLALTADTLAGIEQVAFRYRLDDSQWSEPLSGTELSLAGLARTEHRLEVQARLAGGPWSASPATLAFTIPPRWYERLDVQAIALLLVFIVLGVLQRERTRRLQERVRRLKEAEEFRGIFGRFVTPQVAEEALSGRLSSEGRLVEVTVLFADIRGFTPLSEQLAPDQLVAILNRWYTLTITEIEREGGVVNKLLGDAVVAIWGAPREQEDHADRAVRAAVALLRALDAAGDALEAEFGVRLESGAGINSGAVVAGAIGAPSRSEYTVIGEAVNVAARVEALTRAVGEPLLLTEATRSRLQGEHALRAAGVHPLKGVSEPVTVWTIEIDDLAEAPTWIR